jgi:hypothetical protein
MLLSSRKVYLSDGHKKSSPDKSDEPYNEFWIDLLKAVT